MPHYLMSVCHQDDYGDNDFSDPAVQKIHTKVLALNEKLNSSGAWVFGGGLRPASSATVVKQTDAGISMTDGPWAETKEQMGGFWVIEAADFDAALDWAKQATVACEVPIELRPFEGVV